MSYVWVPIPSMFTFPFIPVRSQESMEETMAPLNCFEISCSELIEADDKISLHFLTMYVLIMITASNQLLGLRSINHKISGTPIWLSITTSRG